MFGNGLASHIDVTTKLSQSLAIILVKPVEELTSVFIGQSFKDVGHASERIMQLKGCMSIDT